MASSYPLFSAFTLSLSLSILLGTGEKVAEKAKSEGEKTYLTLSISAELPSIGIKLYRRDKATVRMYLQVCLFNKQLKVMFLHQ